MNQDIVTDISNFIVQTFLFGAGERLKNDSSFLAEGLIDSTGVLELVSMVEERYGIEVADHELTPENFDSVNSLANYVSRKLGAQSASIASVSAGV